MIFWNTDTDGCAWYTFKEEDEICELLLTCTEINVDTCSTCTSGRFYPKWLNSFKKQLVKMICFSWSLWIKYSVGEVGCPLFCGAPGLCQGIVINFEDASSVYKCQEACTSFSRCNFYSYDPTTQECFMFETCPTLDDTSCQGCISGSPGCEVGEEGTVATNH